MITSQDRSHAPKAPVTAIRCGNGTRRGRVCRRWVSVGEECPHHGLPFTVRYPDPDMLWDQAIVKLWTEAR